MVRFLEGTGDLGHGRRLELRPSGQGLEDSLDPAEDAVLVG
jgi:hypothetical protein